MVPSFAWMLLWGEFAPCQGSRSPEATAPCAALDKVRASPITATMRTSALYRTDRLLLEEERVLSRLAAAGRELIRSAASRGALVRKVFGSGVSAAFAHASKSICSLTLTSCAACVIGIAAALRESIFSRRDANASAGHG